MRKVRMFPMVLVLVLVLAGAAHAQTYRWVDKDGTEHIGKQPPAGVKAEQVGVKPAQVKGMRSAPPMRSGPAQASSEAGKSPMAPEVGGQRKAE